MRSKVSELGVFSIGLGLIGAILLELFQTALGSNETKALFPIHLGVSLLFLVLGILTLVVKHKAAIWVNLIFLVFGLLVIGGGLGELASVLALVGIVLVIITGRAALKEVSQSKRRAKQSKRRRRRTRVE